MEQSTVSLYQRPLSTNNRKNGGRTLGLSAARPIHRLDFSRGELQIYGDEDHLLASKVIFFMDP